MFLLLAAGLVTLLVAWSAWSAWDRVPILANNGETEMAAAMYGRHASINEDCSLRRANCVRDGSPIQLGQEPRFGNGAVGFRGRIVTMTNSDGTRLLTAALVDDPSRPVIGGSSSTRAVSTARIFRALDRLRQKNDDVPWRSGFISSAGVVSYNGAAATENFVVGGTGIALPLGVPVLISRLPPL